MLVTVKMASEMMVRLVTQNASLRGQKKLLTSVIFFRDEQSEAQEGLVAYQLVSELGREYRSSYSKSLYLITVDLSSD